MFVGNSTQRALLAPNTSGSATGPGLVNVTGGTFSGSGIVSGLATVGTGSGTGVSLARAFGSKKQAALTLQINLSLQADATSTYSFKVTGNEARTDLLVASGVTIDGARIKLKGKTQVTLMPGLVLTVISNTSADPSSGTFSNLTDGAMSPLTATTSRPAAAAAMGMISS